MHGTRRNKLIREVYRVMPHAFIIQVINMKATKSLYQKDNNGLSIIRIKKVIELTGLSRTTIFRRVRDKTMPCSVSISSNCIGWYAHEIEEFLQALPRASTKDRS